MTDIDLLKILCGWLEEEKINLRSHLVRLEKDLYLKPNDQNIKVSIEKIKGGLSLVSEDSVKKYQTFWSSLGNHDRRPCPSCFCRQGRISNLIPLPEDDEGFEWVKCEYCKHEFSLPRVD